MESSTEEPSFKKARTDLAEIRVNKLLEELITFVTINSQNYQKFKTPNNSVSVSTYPFVHVEIENFIESESKDFLNGLLIELKTEVTLEEKKNDLFKFKQSDDLITLKSYHISSLRYFFESTVYKLLKMVTKLPLNGKVDMFLSKYEYTDHLLCHDDELEDRRIAFIFYLTEGWEASFGGTLDLFDSNENKEGIFPTDIVKSIIPALNKFVFFEVSSKSFHQVSEVISPTASRLALSGWFYGEPLKRIKSNLPTPDSYVLDSCTLPNRSFDPSLATPPKECSKENGNTCKTVEKPQVPSTPLNLEDYLTEEYYSDEQIYVDMNESLVKNSVIHLQKFLKESKHSELLEELTPKPSFNHNSAMCIPNICYYGKFHEPLWPFSEESNSIVSKLAMFFHSQGFFEFIENVTEFKIGDKFVLTESELREFRKGSYELLYSDTKQKDAKENEVETETNNGDGNNEEEEEDETEVQVDLLYFFGNFEWKEEYGGEIFYLNGNGKTEVSIKPEPNMFSIVVRDDSIKSCTPYINSLAGDEKYWLYKMTLCIPNEVDQDDEDGNEDNEDKDDASEGREEEEDE